jgi:hypothetical protein
MFRSFIPFILASLGFTMISWATKMPLFEWQFSKIVTDFSSACDGSLPSQWTTRFGESLDVRNKPSLSKDLNIIVSRSSTDESFDRLTRGLYNSRPLLFTGVMLSIGYMWWLLLRDKQGRASHVGVALLFSILAVFICLLLSQVVRLAGPAVGQIPYYSEIRHCRGAITFNATLLKIHYETLLVLLVSIAAEVGSIGLMLR